MGWGPIDGVCIVDETGKRIAESFVPSDPDDIFKTLGVVPSIERAVIESGRMTPSICRGLKELGVNIVCVHAHQAHVSLKAMRANKTDPNDAQGLAQLARTGFYKEVHVKSAASHGVKSIIAARAQLVTARVGIDNTIRGVCVAFGIKVGAGSGKAFVERALQAETVPGLGEAVQSLLKVRAGLLDEIRVLDRLLKDISQTSTACQQLMSIPGVGVQTSAAFAAAVDTTDRFHRSRDVGAYFGLVPRRHQSGDVDFVGRITKQGDSTVRKLLYEAANSIITRCRKTFSLRSWALKLARKRGLKKARVALARRLGQTPCCDHACHASGWHFV